MNRGAWRYGSAALAVGAMLAAGIAPAAAAPPERDDIVFSECTDLEGGGQECLSSTGTVQVLETPNEMVVVNEKQRDAFLFEDGSGYSLEIDGQWHNVGVAREGFNAQVQTGWSHITLVDSDGNECQYKGHGTYAQGQDRNFQETFEGDCDAFF